MNAAAFDVLLTDLRLPDMSGVDLAWMVIGRHPAIRVLFASGEIAFAEDATDFPWQTLCKSYSLLEREEALRDAGRPP